MIRLFHWGMALLFLITATNAFAVVTPPPRGARVSQQDVSTPLGRDQLATALDNTVKTRDALIKLPDSGFSNIGDLVQASKAASEILPDGMLGPTSGNAGTDRGLASAGAGRSGGLGSGGSAEQPRTMEKRDGTSFTDTSDPVVSSSPPSTSGGSGNSTTDKLIGGVSDAPPQNFNASTDGVFGSVSDFSSLPPAFSANLGDNFGKYGDFSSFLPPPNTDTGTFEAASKFSSDSAAVAKGSNAPAFTMPDMTKTMAATNASKPLNDNLGGNGTPNTLVANVFPTGATSGTPPAAGTTGTPADDKAKAVAAKVAALKPDSENKSADVKAKDDKATTATKQPTPTGPTNTRGSDTFSISKKADSCEECASCDLFCFNIFNDSEITTRLFIRDASSSGSFVITEKPGFVGFPSEVLKQLSKKQCSKLFSVEPARSGFAVVFTKQGMTSGSNKCHKGFKDWSSAPETGDAATEAMKKSKTHKDSETQAP